MKVARNAKLSHYVVGMKCINVSNSKILNMLCYPTIFDVNIFLSTNKKLYHIDGIVH